MSSLSFDDLKPRAAEFISLLARADFAAAHGRFDETMKKAVPEPKLKESWQYLLAQAGTIRQLSGVSTAESQNYKIVTITCQFEKAAVDVQLAFDDRGQIVGLNFLPATASSATPYQPPAYVDQSRFHEADVTVGSGGEWALPGTLSMPEGAGPFPGVVLVHGSGPNDRDETVGANKVFRDLAWGLASRNIAVLRYDKRTLVHGQKFKADYGEKCTVKEEVVDDALLALQLLRQMPGVDPKRVFLLGHSLGATLVPRIGQQDRDLAGLIIVAGFTRSLEDTILDQITYLYGLAGSLTEQQKADIEVLKLQVARVKGPELSAETPSKDLPLGMPAMYVLDMRSYRPAEVAKTLPMPMLILQGERDYQVTAAQDFECWKAALQGRANVALRLFPKLNHLFISGEGKSTPQEYGIEGHMDQEVVNAIAQWIDRI